MTDLQEFQLAVARRWRERAASIDDSYAQFFFLFAAFNALYFLWKEVDLLRGSHGRPSEREQIDHLVAKLSDPDQLAKPFGKGSTTSRHAGRFNAWIGG